MMWELVIGWTFLESLFWIAWRLARPGIVLWALLGHPPLLIYLAAVVVLAHWMLGICERAMWR